MGDEKGNPTLPKDKSKGVQKVVENVENNTRRSQSQTDGITGPVFLLQYTLACGCCTDPSFNAQYSMNGQEMHTRGW